MEELKAIMQKFAASGWNLIAVPAQEWLYGNSNKDTLVSAIEQADKECGSCGCELDPLYKRASIIQEDRRMIMERFKKIYHQGTIDVIEIWVDTETGVNYVFHRNGNAAGFTPLLDKDGKPIVTQ